MALLKAVVWVLIFLKSRDYSISMKPKETYCTTSGKPLCGSFFIRMQYISSILSGCGERTAYSRERETLHGTKANLSSPTRTRGC